MSGDRLASSTVPVALSALVSSHADEQRVTSEVPGRDAPGRGFCIHASRVGARSTARSCPPTCSRIRHAEPLREPASSSTVRRRRSSALAGRHHLQIVRRLNDGAVLAADSHDLANLAADFSVDHLSGDLAGPDCDVGVRAGDRGRSGVGGELGGPARPRQRVRRQRPGRRASRSWTPASTPRIRRSRKRSSRTSASCRAIRRRRDAFGHGTHVAGIIAGHRRRRASRVTPLYNGGIAPGAQLVNVRVLGADGSGLTSDVIAGIDWVDREPSALQHSRHQSLARPSGRSSRPRPIRCARRSPARSTPASSSSRRPATTAWPRTARRSSAASCRRATRRSPSPSVPLNTQGTARRSDDTVATYSSRGPTRYDFAVKPDLAAPGNRIVSLEVDRLVLSVRTIRTCTGRASARTATCS